MDMKKNLDPWIRDSLKQRHGMAPNISNLHDSIIIITSLQEILEIILIKLEILYMIGTNRQMKRNKKEVSLLTLSSAHLQSPSHGLLTPQHNLEYDSRTNHFTSWKNRGICDSFNGGKEMSIITSGKDLFSGGSVCFTRCFSND